MKTDTLELFTEMKDKEKTEERITLQEESVRIPCNIHNERQKRQFCARKLLPTESIRSFTDCAQWLQYIPAHKYL
ncbi:hypothetical protein CapIbe_009161 [Capra ibex]